MSKSVVVVYQSKKTGNTKRLVSEVLKRNPGIKVFHALQAKENRRVIRKADLVILASGIYFGFPEKKLTEFAKTRLKPGQKVFTLLTHGSNSDHYRDKWENLLKDADVNVVGGASCQGYYYFGPFKLVGGMHTQTPTPEEIDRVVNELEECMDREL